jgi:hypothetical protein
LPTSDSDEILASIVWIGSKREEDGTTIAEIIYERHDEPDLLREIRLPAEDLYPGAVRGDSVFVRQAAQSIRKAST